MTKRISSIMTILMLITLTACGGGQSNQSTPTNEPYETQAPTADLPDPSNQPTSTNEPKTEDNAKILIAYFSMPETTSASNMTEDEDNSVVVIGDEVIGNTEYVAMLIKENTGGDMFRIEPATPYPIDHDTLVDLADKEQKENARPELLANVENLEKYDVIFLGYPNWWGDMPMALYTFLENHDLSGKTIIPFNTHGGSGFSNTIQTIVTLQPNATVITDGFTVSRNNVEDCADNVATWIEQQGYTKIN